MALKLTSIRLDQEIQKKIEALAKVERRTTAQMLRILLEEALETREKDKQEKPSQ